MNQYLLMSFGASIIGISPILSKAVAIHPTAIGFFRFFFGSLAMGLTLLIFRVSLRDEKVKKAWPYFAISGAFFALDLWFWHRSIVYIGAGIATILANTQTFYLTVIGMLIYKERPRWYFYPAMITAFIGIGLMSFPHLKVGELDKNFMGLVYGLLTGVTYAFVTFFLRKGTTILGDRGPLGIFIVSLSAALFSLLATIGEGQLIIPSNRDLLLMVIYGSGVHFLGWYSISRAISKIPLAVTGLLLLLQPTVATLLGAYLFQELFAGWQIVGFVLSLAGIYFATISR